MKEKYHMFKVLVPVTIIASSIAFMANADMSLQCGDGAGNRRLVHVDEGWSNKMTVWNPETPGIKIKKETNDISKGHFKAFENDAWRLIYDTNKSSGSLTNKTFGDKYGCL